MKRFYQLLTILLVVIQPSSGFTETADFKCEYIKNDSFEVKLSFDPKNNAVSVEGLHNYQTNYAKKENLVYWSMPFDLNNEAAIYIGIFNQDTGDLAYRLITPYGLKHNVQTMDKYNCFISNNRF